MGNTEQMHTFRQTIVRGLTGLALSVLCIGLSACNFTSEKPLIPKSQAAYPLPAEAMARLYERDDDDPQKWTLSWFTSSLKPDRTQEIISKYEGADLGEDMRIEDTRYSYPDIYDAFAILPIRTTTPGYWIGETWFMFAALDDSPNEYLLQMRNKTTDEDGAVTYTYVFGTARLASNDRLFISIPDIDDLPRSLYSDFDCSASEYSVSCNNLETFDNMKTAISRTSRDYKYYLKLGRAI